MVDADLPAEMERQQMPQRHEAEMLHDYTEQREQQRLDQQSKELRPGEGSQLEANIEDLQARFGPNVLVQIFNETVNHLQWSLAALINLYFYVDGALHAR